MSTWEPNPPSPPPPRPPGPPNPPRPPGPGRPLALVAAALAVISVSIALAPLGVRVWASQSMTAWMAHDAFMVGLLVAAVVLYLGVSLIAPRPMRRLANGDRIIGNVYVIGTQMDPEYDPPSGSLNPAATVPPAGPRVWGARSSRPGPAPEPTVSTSPGPGSGAPIRLPWLGMSGRGKAGTGQAMPGTARQGNNKRPRT